MVHSRYLHRRGFYNIVTTFLFIVIILFTVLAVIYYGAVIVGFKTATNEELTSYEIISDAKDRIMSQHCYSQPMHRELLDNQTCVMEGELVKGYSILEPPYKNCTPGNWTFMFEESYTYVQTYIVPIEDGEFVCPGYLKVFI